MGVGGQPEHKKDLDHEKFIRVWQEADSMEEVSRILNMEHRRVANIAGYMRHNGVRLQHYSSTPSSGYDLRTNGWEGFAKAWNESACVEEVCLLLGWSRNRTLIAKKRYSDLNHPFGELKRMRRSNAKADYDRTPAWKASLDKLNEKGLLDVFDITVLAYRLKVSRQRSHQIILSGLSRGLIRKLPCVAGKVYKYLGD